MIIKNIKIIKKNIKKNKIVIIFFLIFALLTILFLFKRYSGFSVGAPNNPSKKRPNNKKRKPPARRVEMPSSHRGHRGGSLPPINIRKVKKGNPPVSIDPQDLLDRTSLGSSQVPGGQPQRQLEPRRAGGYGGGAPPVSPQIISYMSSNIDAIFEKGAHRHGLRSKLGREARLKYTKGYQEGTPEFQRRFRAFSDIWNDKLKEFKEQQLQQQQYLPEPVEEPVEEEEEEEELGPQPEPEALASGGVPQADADASALALALEVRGAEQPGSQRRNSSQSRPDTNQMTTANMTVQNLRNNAEDSRWKSRLPNSRQGGRSWPRDFDENQDQQDEIDRLKLKQIVTEFYRIDQRLGIILEARGTVIRHGNVQDLRDFDSNNEIKKHIKTLQSSEKKIIYDQIKKYYSSAEIEKYKSIWAGNLTDDRVLVSLLVDIVNPRRTYTDAPRKAYMVNNPGLSSTNGAVQPEVTSDLFQSGVSFKYDNTNLSPSVNFQITDNNLNAIINITSPKNQVTGQSIGGDGKWERNLEKAKDIVVSSSVMNTIITTPGLFEKQQFAQRLNLVVDEFSPRKFLHKPAYKAGEFGGPWNKKHETAVFSSTTKRSSGWRKMRATMPKRIPFLDIKLQERSRNAAKFKTLFEAINKKPKIITMKNLKKHSEERTDNINDRETRFSVAYVAKLSDEGYISPITLNYITDPASRHHRGELKQLVLNSVDNQKDAMRAVSVGDTAKYARIVRNSNQEFLQIKKEYDAIPWKFKTSDGKLEMKARIKPDRLDAKLGELSAAEEIEYEAHQVTNLRYKNKLAANELLKNIGNQQIGTIGSLQIDTEELGVALDAIFAATDQISRNVTLKPKTERSVEKLRESSKRMIDGKQNEKLNKYLSDVHTEGIFRRKHASDKIFADFQKESRRYFQSIGINPDDIRGELVTEDHTVWENTHASQLQKILAESMYVYTFERYQLDSVIGEKKNEVKEELDGLPVPDDHTPQPERERYLDLNRRFFYLSNLPTQINRNLAPEQLYNIAERIVRDESPDVTGMESLIDYKGRKQAGLSSKKQAATRVLKHSVLGLAAVGATIATGGGAAAGILTVGAASGGAEIASLGRRTYKTTTSLGVSRNPTDANGSFKSRIEKPKKQKFFLRPPATQMGGGMNDAEARFMPTLDSNQTDDEMNAAGTVGNFHPPGVMPDNAGGVWSRRGSITINDAHKTGVRTSGGLNDSVFPVMQDQINGQDQTNLNELD